MPIEVTVDHPEAGDQDIFINGLGTFRNGQTATVDDDQIMRFRAMNSVQKTTHNEDGTYTVENELGPEPQDLEIRGVTIKVVEAKGEKADETPAGKAPADQEKATAKPATATTPDTPAPTSTPEGSDK